MFRLNRNERSHWSGNGVHVESELVFMIGRNMQRDESGKLQHEELPLPMKAAPGSWIVCIEDTGLPMGLLYIASLSRDGKTRASTEIRDARGFSHEQAVELATQLQSKPNRTAKVEQVLA
ncbi:hypothetical protein RI534_12920 [Aeromonas allosaccharophila]|uniref:hypothetical protein n=1 Tax=Aeromonas allosaccharophila TaxID=656 RepID=UPI003437FBDD